jgi:N-dimethylarginine dimethylaminohydrolase
MTTLGWGRRYLLCPPEHFTVAYEINPYMHVQVHPDPGRAMEEFEGLVHALESVGATVELLTPVEGLPDLVFTANAGVVDGDMFVPSRFLHPERQGETAHDERWFDSHGFAVTPLPGDDPFEGAGDALPFGGGPGERHPAVVVGGYRTRSSFEAHRKLAELLAVPVRTVELIDDRYYHVDLVFCPLDDRRALVAPQGLDRYGTRVLSELVPEPIWLEDDEAQAFCANSVVVGEAVVMPSCPVRLGRILEQGGFSVVIAPVGEFLKAGGGCRCLTLALDVVLGVQGSVSTSATMTRGPEGQSK